MTDHTQTTPSIAGTLTYEGTDIRRRGHQLNLTDMWRAAGAPGSQRPNLWLTLDETMQFRSYLRTRPHHSTSRIAFQEIGHDITNPLQSDGLVKTSRKRNKTIWAHWQLALAYAQYLSPPVHRWCLEVVRTAMEQPRVSIFSGDEALVRYLERRFGFMQSRLDDLDRNSGDLMFLAASAQELLLGKRREFSERSRQTIRVVVSSPPYAGLCPCCGETEVLSARGLPLPGADFDHFFHSGLNRPEHGWLICRSCHYDVTNGGYLIRFAKMPEFRAFQTQVVAQRRKDSGSPAS